MASTAAITTECDAVAEASARVVCNHCGALCIGGAACRAGGFAFCCQGCRTVFELLTENGLDRFYQLEQRPGVRPADGLTAGAFAYLDDEATRRS